MFQSARGMQDSLPEMTAYWSGLEKHLRSLAHQYSYQEIRFPIVERTDLFQHSIGNITDIVEKEMYQLQNKGTGDNLSLRPEGTASCVRAAIEHRLVHQSIPQRLWYLGPMFRHERPQKGRYRQFHQFGVEVFGIYGPSIDAELIAMTSRLWKNLNIDNLFQLEINSLGNYSERAHYRSELVQYFETHVEALDDDSKRRLHTNPLRILDSKNPKLAIINQGAPKLLDYLGEESAAHFQQVQSLLTILNIPFTINPYLVRGLDYYNKTVFEWVIKDANGAQNTVCAGGRYDGLVKQLGGPDKPAIGFAIGLERLLEIWKHLTPSSALVNQKPDIYLIHAGSRAELAVSKVSEKLRNIFPALNIQVDCLGGNFSAQFKRANKIGAYCALVLGENELNNQTITVKPLRTSEPQSCMTWDNLLTYLQTIFASLTH